MEKYIDDSNIHSGHRARMRAKLISHGQGIFDTYELLEMLLYYVIPCRDTNPIAKNLLRAFCGLDGVLSADKDDLLSVKGVGDRAAELICKVGMLSDIIGAELLSEECNDFSNYESVGRYLVDYFSTVTDRRVVALYLDSSMRLISMQRMYDLDYESGGVKAKPFIDEALKSHAAVVITAHNHPYGPFYPTQGDRATHTLITESFNLVGVLHAEHYIICGDRFAGMGCLKHFTAKLSQMPAVSEFIDTRDKYDGSMSNVAEGKNSCSVSGLGGRNIADLEYFAGLLAFSGCNDPYELAEYLIAKHRTIEYLLDTSVTELRADVGEQTAIFIKLLAYLTSRRATDKFDLGEAHTSVEIADYFKALFIGESVEKIYLVGFDKKGRTVGVSLLGEGTVSSSEVMPRKAMEAAVGMSASAVSIAHNHPFGMVNPSDDDVNMTQIFATMFTGCEIEFREHYIIAGQLCDTVFYGDNEVS